MKTMLMVIGLLVMSSVCWGQSLAGAGSGQQAPYTNTYVMQEHPQHADRHALAAEQSLVGGGTMTEAHGERPLWEFGSDKVEIPLGTVARQYRDTPRAKLAQIYWEQQGKK